MNPVPAKPSAALFKLDTWPRLRFEGCCACTPADRCTRECSRSSFENRNQIHLFERRGSGHGIVPLFAAVTLEEIARLYWPFNNRGGGQKSLRDLIADAFAIKDFESKRLRESPLFRPSWPKTSWPLGTVHNLLFVILSFVNCLTFCELSRLSHGDIGSRG